MSRLWMYAELPIPASEIGDLKHYKMVGTDPIELLRAAAPFIGWPSVPQELKTRVDDFLEAFPDTTAKED